MYKLKYILGEAINPSVVKANIQKAFQMGKNVGIFANGKNLDITSGDKEALGIDSVWAADDDGKEFEVRYGDIEFITVDGKRMEEGTLNGPAPEDPDTSGMKFNKNPIVPKQTAFSPYDIVDEASGRMTPEAAADTLYNGNISDFKVWAKNATKSELLDAVVSYGELSSYGTDGAIKYIKRFVI